MNQENGMLLKFQAWDKISKEMHNWSYLKQLMIVETHENVFTNEDLIFFQAIGATDSSDPKQELYLGDLIEFEYAGRIIGEVVWKDWEVLVKYRPFGEAGIDKRGCVYLGFKTVFEYRFGEKRQSIKKLGSRYTHPEILKKAGLE